jgi:hypothetical protein
MPSTPTGVTVTKTGANTAVVSWTAVPGADGYSVYLIANGDVYAPQAVPGGGALIVATTYTVGIVSGRVYGVKVTATAASVESARSTPVWLDNSGATPDPSLVYFTAGNFGPGLSLVPTLTLPDPADVLATAPPYGVGGNASQGRAVARVINVIRRIIRVGGR